MFDIESGRFHKGMPMARASLAGTVRTFLRHSLLIEEYELFSSSTKDSAGHSRTDHA
ncbi:hypothetical protein [Burkholderia orbicola]|uniref:hypothetical protein n=1 Tax=Burkholderia orbicola TaxID=2978683 RepID=UPI001F48EADA|nr:hypothetical protein [Burkholderia orbicola]